MCSYLGWCVGEGWVSDICVGSLGELLGRGIGYTCFWGSGVLLVYIFATLIEKILIQNSPLSLHSHFIFVFLMLSTITVFHFLGPIWCLSICSWTGTIGAYKWVMYCDLPLEQHYVIKEKSHSSLFSITFNLFLCSESYFHHFSITFKLFLCSYSYSSRFIISWDSCCFAGGQWLNGEITRIPSKINRACLCS